MSLHAFFKLVEIQTKLASLFPFLVGSLFVLYRYETFKPVNTIIFFCSMLLFDLTTTAINNYMDYKKATSESYRKEKNIIGQENIQEWIIITTIFLLLITATALGIVLVTKTDLLVLIIGMICFAIGILYTFGPIPISRMPLGEIFSGVTMGFGILFLIVYVNAYDKGIANLIWSGTIISLRVDVIKILEIVLVSLPCIFTIANIMLANNICDLDEDIKNKRFTLPYYIGRKYAIWLFNALYFGAFIAILVAIMLNLLPKIMLLSLIAGIPVYKHVKLFNKKQSKYETFSVSVKNLIIINGSIITLLCLAVLI